MPHNQILRCSCNIGTDAHLLFNKVPKSEFQECFGKVLYTLYFIQVHMIVMNIWNEWFGWIHSILIWNNKTSFLSFHDCIFPHPSPMIWLLYLCHLFCLDFTLFFNLMNYFILSMLLNVGILLELNSIRSCRLSLVVWNLDGYFSAPEDARCFYRQEGGWLFSPHPDFIYLLPFL